MSKRLRHSRTSSTADNDETDWEEQELPSAKVIELDPVDNAHASAVSIHCSLPPHPQLLFHSLEAFDVHYAREHTNRCTSCSKNFPSAHFLTLHIDEHHNPIRESLAAQGAKTYACYVEECEKLCSTPQKRRLHLIDKHMFPKAYDFRVIHKGIDKSQSLLRGHQKRRLSTTLHTQRRHHSTAIAAHSDNNSREPLVSVNLTEVSDQISTGNSSKAENKVESASVDTIEKSLASLQFVPPSVQASQRRKQ